MHMSTRWDAQQLLQPVTAEQPCGENLEDTPLLASFDGFRVFGQSTPLDPVPDWGDVKTRALEALGKSKDLRLLAHLGSAVLRTDGLRAFADTLTVASRWLDTYWTQTYPLVTEDVIFRRNALNCLADPAAIVDGLRRVPLVSTRQHGTFTLRDIDIVAGQLQPREGESHPDEVQVNAAFAAMPTEELTAQQASIADATAAVRSIEARMREAAGSEAAPNFDALSTQLTKLQRFLGAQLATRRGSEVPDAAEPGAGVSAAATAPAVGAIKSRDDAIRALDAIAEFFRRTEPSSPIPLIVERAKRLVSKDFLEVLADVAPEALTQARAAGGLRQTD
jgi:type VI secretion system protein ImpA